jgi:hypothetical protein
MSMGDPDLAPHIPLRSERHGAAETLLGTPPILGAPRRSRDAPRDRHRVGRPFAGRGA